VAPDPAWTRVVRHHCVVSDLHGRTKATPGDLNAWGWFAAWTLAGSALALGFVSFALWVILIPIGLGLVLLLLASRSARQSAYGLLSGTGISLLTVAYIQRDGPGTTCWQTATASGCEQHLDPRPWLIAGVLCLVGGLVAQTILSVRRRDSRST
jgi:hypothetical protein